ncbi:MAG TPA: hypothetical protein VI756_15130 [Blastocatellia bacterium]
MKLEYVPLLAVQRELYGIPRGMERFRAYLSTMVDPATGDLALPLPGMNPMGKDHVPMLLDQYLSAGSDEAAASAVCEAESLLSEVPGTFKVTLVLSDDAAGGWTNRYTSEFTARFGTKSYQRRGWIVGTLWTADPASPHRARQEALTAVYRTAHIQRNGYAVILGEMLRQEGYALSRAGCDEPKLNPEEIDYTREVISPYLETKDHASVMACLFGDEAAATLGYRPLGLSNRAGLALALYDARRTG